jgi:hypothetical protein
MVREHNAPCLSPIVLERERQKFIVVRFSDTKGERHTHPCEQRKAQDLLRVFTPRKQDTSDDPTGRVGEELAPYQHYRTSEEGQTPAARSPKGLQTCKINWAHSGRCGVVGRVIGATSRRCRNDFCSTSTVLHVLLEVRG